MPWSTAATVTKASSPAASPGTWMPISRGARGLAFSVTVSSGVRRRSPGSTAAQARPRARAGMRLAARSMGRNRAAVT